jgi:hypothetical protein
VNASRKVSISDGAESLISRSLVGPCSFFDEFPVPGLRSLGARAPTVVGVSVNLHWITALVTLLVFPVLRKIDVQSFDHSCSSGRMLRVLFKLLMTYPHRVNLLAIFLAHLVRMSHVAVALLTSNEMPW